VNFLNDYASCVRHVVSFGTVYFSRGYTGGSSVPKTVVRRIKT